MSTKLRLKIMLARGRVIIDELICLHVDLVREVKILRDLARLSKDMASPQTSQQLFKTKQQFLAYPLQQNLMSAHEYDVSLSADYMFNCGDRKRRSG